MLNTDLDGTLLNDERRIGADDLATLAALGETGVVRVIATGRSLWSARRVLPLDLPLDYLVFSSGVGTVRWPACDLVDHHTMTPDEATQVLDVLKSFDCDFMVQHAAPDSHRFDFHSGTRAQGNSDFSKRVGLYEDYARPLQAERIPPASQFVVVHPNEGGVDRFQAIRDALPHLNVVRTTSPLDKHSVWIEVFPAHVSKAAGCASLAEAHGIDHALTMAVGNDYNDDDLLEWATHSFVVANGPADLKARHSVVASNCDGGVSDAVRHWYRRQEQ